MGLADAGGRGSSDDRRQVKGIGHEIHVSRRSVPAQTAPSECGGRAIGVSAQSSSTIARWPRRWNCWSKRTSTARRIGRSIVRCWNCRRVGEVIDQITLTERLKAQGEIEAVGGAAYLAELVQSVASSANIRYHCKIVRDKALAARADPYLHGSPHARVRRHLFRSMTCSILRSGRCSASCKANWIGRSPPLIPSLRKVWILSISCRSEKNMSRVFPQAFTILTTSRRGSNPPILW